MLMIDGKGHDLCMWTGNVNISKHTNFVLNFFPLFSLSFFLSSPTSPSTEVPNPIVSIPTPPPPPFFFFYKRTLRILSAEF